MMAKRTAGNWVAALGCGLAFMGCGGEPAATVEPAAAASGEERVQAPAEDSLQVEGLKGTLTPQDVERGLEPRMLKFAVCPGRSSDLEFIAGEMAFHFTVAPDGHVTDVYGTRSSLGDRATEQCMLKVAAGAKFAKPRGGGEAEFDWSLEIPDGRDVRPPVVWDADQAAPLLADGGAELVESCGGAPHTVTAYVDTDGSVMAAGAVNAQQNSEAALDCVVAGVEGWTFASPGSYPAKISFTLQ